MLNKLMPHPLLIFSQLDYLIQVVIKNLNTEWQTVQIYTVCKGRAYPGSAGQGFNQYLTIIDQKKDCLTLTSAGKFICTCKPQKRRYLTMQKLDIFLVSPQNICCGYLFEVLMSYIAPEKGTVHIRIYFSMKSVWCGYSLGGRSNDYQQLCLFFVLFF